MPYTPTDTRTHRNAARAARALLAVLPRRPSEARADMREAAADPAAWFAAVGFDAAAWAIDAASEAARDTRRGRRAARIARRACHDIARWSTAP